MSALDGLTDTPTKNGLNAATAAGIEIAKNALAKNHRQSSITNVL